MGRNIELKARCPDLAAAREAAKGLGATFEGILNQRDTYYVTNSGRLKLREIDGRGAELIAYARDDSAAVRASDYQVIPTPNPQTLGAALASTLGVRVVVAKRRELWMWQRVRIHLDDVAGLGTFVEFEAVMEEGEPDEAGHDKILTLRSAMAIPDADLIGVSYSDLLLAATA